MVLGHSFKTNCFEYRLVMLLINNEIMTSVNKATKGVLGWELKAIDGITKFECPSEIKGYPVISLEKTFMNYKDEYINIKCMNTSNVISMKETFFHSHIKEIDLGEFDFTNIEDMDRCFKYCDVQRIQFGKDKKANKLWALHETFFNCSRLTDLDMSGFKAFYLSNANSIFLGCSSLKRVDMRNFDSNMVLGELERAKESNKDLDLDYVIISSGTYKNKAIDYGLEIVECTEGQIDKIIKKSRLLTNKSFCIIVKK